MEQTDFKERFEVPGGLEIAYKPLDKSREDGAIMLTLLVDGKPSGIDLVYDPIEQKGGHSFTLDFMLNGHTTTRTCGCNGTTINCPAGKSPHCNCTTNPVTLTCG